MDPLVKWAKEKLTFQENEYSKKAVLLTYYYGVYRDGVKPSLTEITKQTIKVMGEMYHTWAKFPKKCMNKKHKKYSQLYTKARGLTVDEQTLVENLSELTYNM